MNFFFRIKKCPGPVVFGIVLELKCVSRYKSFGRIYKTSQSIFIVFNKSCVHCVRSIAGHYKQNRNRMRGYNREFLRYKSDSENKPFIQSAERSCHFRKIIWRTDNESVKVITFLQSLVLQMPVQLLQPRSVLHKELQARYVLS